MMVTLQKKLDLQPLFHNPYLRICHNYDSMRSSQIYEIMISGIARKYF